MTDREFTRLLGNQLLNAKGYYDYGLKKGLVTPDALRLTIAKRRETARALVNGGMSRRKVAKALGVGEATIRRDVRQNDAKSASELRTRPLGGFSANRTTRELLAQSDQNDWRTPRKYLDAAREVMGGIDLDPASSAEANETVKATVFYTENDNGLGQSWKGKVWLNPPYGGEARLFIERLIREYQVGNITAACALVNSAGTETKWYQELFNYTICFVRGRIDFGGPSRKVSSTSTHGSAIVYLGPDIDKFIARFSAFGAVVRKAALDDIAVSAEAGR
jgi:phage N-6-adenine-methyltransferase